MNKTDIRKKVAARLLKMKSNERFLNDAFEYGNNHARDTVLEYG